MKTDQLLNPPAIHGAAQSGSVAALTGKIKTLVADIAQRGRLLKADRIKAGHLLIQLRDKFTSRNKDGAVLRGPQGGTFCAHLLAHGLNLGSCYGYIALAEGRVDGAVPVRVAYWQKFNLQMKVATPRQRVALLKKAVRHICKLYKIQADVTVRGK